MATPGGERHRGGPSRSGESACCAPASAAPRPGDAQSIADVFKALSSPMRLRVLWLLDAAVGGEVCVCDLVDELGVTQPTVSHHLKVLVDAGLVRGERRGTWVWYSSVPERVVEVQRLLGGGGR